MKRNLFLLLSVVLTMLLISQTNSVVAQVNDPPEHVFEIDISGTATLTSYGGYDQIYLYEYTLTFAENNTKDISHWSLQLSLCTDDADLIDPSYTGGEWEYDKPCFNEPVLDEEICGIKWDAQEEGYSSGSYTFEFYSLGKPTTVNWYAKNGEGYTDNGPTIGPNCDDPIPVELNSFAAQTDGKTVTLKWTTATETENLGFHVYRNTSEKGDYVQITKEMILGSGSSDEAHSYNYTDRDVKSGNTYYYKLADVDFNGNINFHGPISVTIESVLDNYSLAQCYPNPFNPETAINFSLKKAGKVSLKIYNLQGQLIRTLVDEDKSAGSYSVMWDGTNSQGIRVSSGTYLYTLKVNDFENTKKMTFMQ